MREHKPLAPTSFRLADDVLGLLRLAAQRERRSQASMLEVMILDWCRRHDVEVTRTLTTQGDMTTKLSE